VTTRANQKTWRDLPLSRNYPNSWNVDPPPANGMSLATQGLKENNNAN